jgi:hypothetical protein
MKVPWRWEYKQSETNKQNLLSNASKVSKRGVWWAYMLWDPGLHLGPLSQLWFTSQDTNNPKQDKGLRFQCSNRGLLVAIRKGLRGTHYLLSSSLFPALFFPVLCSPWILMHRLHVQIQVSSQERTWNIPTINALLTSFKEWSLTAGKEIKPVGVLQSTYCWLKYDLVYEFKL